jgi:heme/copper-type cytochrome/quinol oxidase subunit 2
MKAKSNGLMLILMFSPVVGLMLFSLIDNVFAQNAEEYVVRRVEIWGLFYRLMVVAFVVGAVVQGSIVYVCWRFRESNPKNRPREPYEGVH